MAKKSAGTSTVTQGPDQATLDRIKQLWGAADTAAAAPVPGVNPITDQSADVYRRAMSAGNLGFGALSGDQASIDQLSNPYTSGVIDRVIGDADRLRAGTMSQVDAAATAAGAFGGSRHGVATGTALADVDRSILDKVATLRETGYNTAMDRATTLANLGFGGASGGATLGDYMRRVAIEQDPTQRKFQAYLQAMGVSPSGQTQTSTGTAGRNPINGFLGGASALGGLASMLGASNPVGWGLAGLGGLLGLFG